MKSIKNYTVFLILGMAALFTSCHDDDLHPSKSACKIESIERHVPGNNFRARSQSYQYGRKGILTEFTRQTSLVATFEYNPQGLVTKMDYGNTSPTQTAYVWKYNRNVLSEVEVHNFGAKQFSYFFTFDNRKRLTKITSDNPGEYIYLFEYIGKSRNPSKRIRHYVLREGEEIAGFPTGTEILTDSTVYQYDDQKHPETTLKGFQVSPEYLGRILEPIPDNNIIREDTYSIEYDDINDKLFSALYFSLITTYDYNLEGFPIQGTSTPLPNSPYYWEEFYTFTYQDCKKVLD